MNKKKKRPIVITAVQNEHQNTTNIKKNYQRYMVSGSSFPNPEVATHDTTSRRAVTHHTTPTTRANKIIVLLYHTVPYHTLRELLYSAAPLSVERAAPS